MLNIFSARKIELCVTACTNKRLLCQGSGSDQTVFMVGGVDGLLQKAIGRINLLVEEPTSPHLLERTPRRFASLGEP